MFPKGAFRPRNCEPRCRQKPGPYREQGETMGFAKAKREEPSSWSVAHRATVCAQLLQLQHVVEHTCFVCVLFLLSPRQQHGDVFCEAATCVAMIWPEHIFFACARAGHSICAHTPVGKLEWKSDARGATIPYGDTCCAARVALHRVLQCSLICSEDFLMAARKLPH